jgi:quaternary ammonium compound-resistance protein SugE
MAWIVVVVSGLLETVWAIALARSEGFSKPAWVALFLVAGVASLAGLAYALRELPVGTAYAVWTGLGAAGTAVVGMVLLGEPAQVLRILCVLLIVIAVVGLQATSTHA